MYKTEEPSGRRTKYQVQGFLTWGLGLIGYKDSEFWLKSQKEYEFDDSPFSNYQTFNPSVDGLLLRLACRYAICDM